MAGLRSKYELQLAGLRGSDTAKAAGLAGAMIANNVIALGSTVVFARLLSDYGSLAALISYFLILTVAGQAMQVATAREGVLGHLGVGPASSRRCRRWTGRWLWVTAALTVLSILLRHPIADAVGVKQDPWAAAIGLPAGCLWLEISILRGALQGVGDYKSVGLSLIGEQAMRLVIGAALAASGSASPAPISARRCRSSRSAPTACCSCGAYARQGRRRRRRRRRRPPAAFGLWHARHAGVGPIAGLVVIAVLQNIDIIAAKHNFTPPRIWPAPTPRRRSPPRCSSGSPSGPASTSSRRFPAGAPPARTRARCCPRAGHHLRLRGPGAAHLRLRRRTR